MSTPDSFEADESRQRAWETRTRTPLAGDDAGTQIEEGKLLVAKLVEAISSGDRLHSGMIAAREQLRSAITDLVTGLRDRGSPPERALVEIKSLVAVPGGLDVERRRDTMDEVVRWTIDAYFAQPVPPAQ